MKKLRFFDNHAEKSSSGKKIRLFPILWIAVVLLAEVFLFNMSSFHLIGGGYEKFSLPLSDAVIRGGTRSDSGAEFSSGTAVLEWKQLGRRIGTVTLDMTLSGASSAELKADVSDDTNAAYRRSIAQTTLVASDVRSHTLILRMSGDVHDLRLAVTVPEGATLRIAGVTANHAVPFRFSAIRAGVLLLAGLFVWLFLAYEPMKRPCAQDGNLSSAVACITIICLLFAFLTVSLRSGGFAGEFRLTTGNQMTKELVDAFEHGQVHLLAEPSEELLALENPYDWSARTEAGVSALWDHCLYDGHYYSYYGIAPVLLLFLPYHLLTGYYFSSVIAVLLFGTLGIVFLSLTYSVFIRKFFPNLPLRLAIFGLLTLQLSSGIWYCFCAMNFYEIAQSAGFCFVTMGAYFLLSANVVGEGRISPARTAIAATALSLAVLSRPTTAVYCVVALVFLGFGLKKKLAERRTAAETEAADAPVLPETVEATDGADGNLKKAPTAKKSGLAAYLVAAILPFALLGGLQMIYNYLRFDSFLDFGIQYSLTINDFTRSEFHARFVSIGIYNYLFAPPVITPEFPYVASSFQTLRPNGYYFIANRYAVGLIWRAIPVLGLLLAPKALRRMKKESRLPALLLIGALSVIAPLAVMFSIWESGYGARYAVDFGWEMLIGGLAVLFYLHETSENEGLRSLGSKAALWTLLPTTVINFALTYDFLTHEISAPIFAHLGSIFNFWY